jgi:hypothetical protein
MGKGRFSPRPVDGLIRGDGRQEGTASSWLETCRIFSDRDAAQGPRCYACISWIPA